MKNKIVIIGSAIIGLLILLLVVLWAITTFSPKFYSYEDVEKKIQDATNAYYKNSPEMLPISDGKSVLPYSTLVENGYIKPLNELLKDGDECSAEVIVYKNSDDYNYIPHLTCGDKYTTKELYQQIFDNSPVVISGSGLYKAENGEYYFRGKVTNNYIALGTTGRGKNATSVLWRIISIDENNNIKMRATVAAPGKTYYDDRYNVTKNSNSGYNTFKTSLLRDYLIQLAESEEFLTADQKKNLIETTVCDMPRSFEDNTKDGSTECSNENPDKLLFTTITPYEYMRASIDENCIHAKDRSCANYNFLTTFGEYGNEWTVTPYTGSDYEVFTYEGGNFNVVKAKTKKNVYVVTTLSSLTRYVSGTGTKTDPYVIIKEKKSTITK